MECPQVERIQEGLGGWTARDRLVNTLAGPTSAALIGGAFALQILVAGACLPRINLTETQLELYVVLVTLVGGLVGAWCPQQLVAGFLKRIWTRVRSHEYAPDDLILLRQRETSDYVLRWLFIGSFASAIGLCQLLIIPLCWPLHSISRFLATEFLWMPITWSAAQLGLIALILCIPSVMLGMVVAGLGAASATGVQLAHELHVSGRPVTLAVGSHNRMPRTYRGMDTFWWLDQIGAFDRTIDEVRDRAAARNEPSFQLVGRPGQHAEAGPDA